MYIPKYIFPLEKCCFALVNFFSLVALFIVALLTTAISVKTVLLASLSHRHAVYFSLGIGLILVNASHPFCARYHTFGRCSAPCFRLRQRIISLRPAPMESWMDVSST